VVARSDKTSDETIRADLLVARRGQAYFSRKLNELSDDELALPSRLPGWTRRHVIAHVGLNARALTHLTEWAASGIETPMYGHPGEREADIELASTLPAQALRNLSDHAAIHLNVEWRDLEPESWNSMVKTGQGRVVPASETVWMRTREVWIHSVDLSNGASFSDFPDEMLDRLLRDVFSAWERRRTAEGIEDFTLVPCDRDYSLGDGAGITVTGTAAQLAAWATGREATIVLADGAPAPAAPRWL
jgi:maleylpyruvate isomerase